jgi:toxin FitB
MFLLDTNVVSELRRPERADPSVVRWSKQYDNSAFSLSVFTVHELEYGTLVLERRDPVRGRGLRKWLAEKVLPDFANRILPATAEIAVAAARMHLPHRRAEKHAWIAATALVHGLTVATRNISDFESTGAKLFNPWTAK